MPINNSFSKRWISSQSWYVQIIGALIKKWSLFFSAFEILCLIGEYFSTGLLSKLLALIAITIPFFIILNIVRILTPIYSLRKEETRITVSQIVLLVAFGAWVIGFVIICDFNQGSAYSMALTVAGGVLGWIFQDTVKSVVAFFYLRGNGLLKVGDWIQVKSHGIDGMVKQITLTTVLIENWDTTISAFPTYILHAEHFQNYQNMLDGKTHGRRMMKTFVIDSGWIQPITEEDKEKLCFNEISSFVSEDKIKEGAMNAELFRLYIYHWLMRQPCISQEPRLIVRWLEHVNEGMPLQVYAFINKTSLAAFEWEQSRIIEHILKMLPMFNLQLFQTTSGYDASNSNIYLSPNKANYRKEQNYAE